MADPAIKIISIHVFKCWITILDRRGLAFCDKENLWVSISQTLKLVRGFTFQGFVSPVAQMRKNLPAMQETQVHSLGQEDPLEKGMATYASMLAWRIHGQGSLVGCRLWGCRVGHDWSNLAAAATATSYLTLCDPHGLQLSRPPCLSLYSGVCSNSCPTISFSVISFSSCPQSLPASGCFPMSQLFASGGLSTGTSIPASVLPMNIQVDLI